MARTSRTSHLAEPSHPLLLLFQPPAILSVMLLAEALAVILTLAPGVGTSRWVYFGVMSLLIQWIALLSLGLLYLGRSYLVRMSTRKVAWLSVAALLATTILLGWTGTMLSQAMWPDAGAKALEVSLQLCGMMLIVGVLSALAFDNHWRSRQSMVRAKQAELEALQARVHPHFLFNTLNSAASLVHARPDDAERVLMDLSDLFRAALSKPGWVPLEAELELCQRYLAIEQQRFGDRLHVQWSIPHDLPAVSVPLLAIQPLIENAVAHGSDARSHGKSVDIEITANNETVHILVRNPVAPAPAADSPHGHRVGLAGVRARVESATHGTGSVETLAEGGYFLARIDLPKAAMPIADQATMR